MAKVLNMFNTSVFEEHDAQKCNKASLKNILSPLKTLLE